MHQALDLSIDNFPAYSLHSTASMHAAWDLKIVVPSEYAKYENSSREVVEFQKHDLVFCASLQRHF